MVWPVMLTMTLNVTYTQLACILKVRGQDIATVGKLQGTSPVGAIGDLHSRPIRSKCRRNRCEYSVEVNDPSASGADPELPREASLKGSKQS